MGIIFDKWLVIGRLLGGSLKDLSLGLFILNQQFFDDGVMYKSLHIGLLLVEIEIAWKV